jgi:hypothetical protein
LRLVSTSVRGIHFQVRCSLTRYRLLYWSLVNRNFQRRILLYFFSLNRRGLLLFGSLSQFFFQDGILRNWGMSLLYWLPLWRWIFVWNVITTHEFYRLLIFHSLSELGYIKSISFTDPSSRCLASAHKCISNLKVPLKNGSGQCI